MSRLYRSIMFALLMSIPLFALANVPKIESQLDGYAYVSPRGGARSVPPESSLLLRIGGSGISSAPDVALFSVTGERSGEHAVAVQLSSDGRSFQVLPSTAFEPGEQVVVSFEGDASLGLPACAWSFNVATSRENSLLRNLDLSQFEEPLVPVTKVSNVPPPEAEYTINSQFTTPSDFPLYSFVTSDSVQPGYTWANVFDAMRNIHWNIIFDQSGEVVYYHRKEYYMEIFEPHEDVGKIAWHDTRNFQGVIYDSTWNEVTRLGPANGYKSDFHEVLLADDGRIGLLSSYIIEEDLSEFGGTDQGTLRAMAVQMFDPDGTLEFEWRSNDDPVLSYGWSNASLGQTNSIIDYLHLNTIEVDDDGNLLISSRHMNALMKLDYDSSKVMWVLGGEGNQFEWPEGVRTFTGQHDVRRLENGNILFFDNGTYSPSRYGRSLELALDEENLIATHVWEYNHQESINSASRGGTRRLPNGNTIISWGSRPSGNLHICEVTPAKTLAGSIQFEEGAGVSNYVTYRVHRSSMRIVTERPQLMLDRLNDEPRLCFAQFGRDDVSGYQLYHAEDGAELALDTVLTGGATSLPMGDWMTGNHQFAVGALYDGGGVSPLASVLTVENGIASGVEQPLTTALPDIPLLRTWPNPFNGTVNVEVMLSQPGKVRLELYNLLGRQVWSSAAQSMPAGVARQPIRLESMASGVYFLRVLSDRRQIATRRIVLVR